MPDKRTTGRRLVAVVIAATLILSMSLPALAATKAQTQWPIISIPGGREALWNSQAGDTLNFVAFDKQYGFTAKSGVKVYLNDALVTLPDADQTLLKNGMVVKTTLTLQKGEYKIVATNTNGDETTKTLTVD